MKPYYQDSAVTLYLGDCREIVPTLGRFDCVLVDPPYGKVKGDFDEEWTNRHAMLKDCAIWRDVLFDAMKPNATLWWFAWPSLAGRIEALIAERLNPLSHVVWLKPTSVAQKHCAEALRAPGPETERIIMAEHYGADNIARGEVSFCGNPAKFVYAEIRDWLRARLPASIEQASADLNWTSASIRHCFEGGTDFWRMPTHAKYTHLQATYPGAFDKTYEELHARFFALRKDYEELRRYFALQTGDQKTDIWRFKPSGNEYGHPTEKPISLISFMVRISCRPGGTLLDCFAGSGTTGRAAKDLGRKCVMVEKDEKHCERIARRMLQEVLPL